jgi:hypothetical protein
VPAYYIGEHIVSDFTLFDAYLAKAVPMIERFGGRYLTKVGSHEILEGGLEAQSGGNHRISRYCIDQELVPGAGISAAHRVAPKHRY